MRILVTGAAGFVGRHLLAELTGAGHIALGADRAQAPGVEHICEIGDAAAVRSLVARTRPDALIHLAGIAFVPAGWTDPQGMIHINVNGTINVLEAVRREMPSSRVLAISSSHIYGARPRPSAIIESDPAEPDSIYAVSKAAADQVTLLYHQRHGMACMTARPGNHIGRGQSPDFVVPSFARQLRLIADGLAPARMLVGNLESRRSFTDVRDVVRAYRLLVEKGVSGRSYNIDSGRLESIGQILETLCNCAGVKPEIVVDPARYRPTDHQPMLDCSRLKTDTGWEPAIRLEESLRDIYDSL